MLTYISIISISTTADKNRCRIRMGNGTESFSTLRGFAIAAARRDNDEVVPVLRGLAVIRFRTRTSVACAIRDPATSSVYRALLPFGAMLKMHRQFAQGRSFRDCAAVGRILQDVLSLV